MGDGGGVHLGYVHFLYIILLEYTCTNFLKRHQIKWLYSIMTSSYKYTLQKYYLNRFYLFFDTNLHIFGYQVEIFKILWKLFSFITYPYRVYIHVYSKCSNHFRNFIQINSKLRLSSIRVNHATGITIRYTYLYNLYYNQ